MQARAGTAKLKTMKPLPRLSLTGAVDGDGHVLEPPDLWQRYLEPGFRDRAPTIRKDNEGREYLEIDGKPSRRLRRGSLGFLGAMGQDFKASERSPERTCPLRIG